MSRIGAGIDPHRKSVTVSVHRGDSGEIGCQSFDCTAEGLAGLVDWLTGLEVDVVGIEGSGSWGRQAALVLVGAGFDCREVPPHIAARYRRRWRSEKSDRADASAAARCVLAEPGLGPVAATEAFDDTVAEIEVVLARRHSLVRTRVLALNQVGAELDKLTLAIRDHVPASGTISRRLRAAAGVEIELDSLRAADQRRLEWIRDFVESDRQTRAQIRDLERRLDQLLDAHGTTLREEPGISTIGAATLLVEIGDPTRFKTESKFARWCGTGCVAVSTGEGDGEPDRHRLDRTGNRRVNSTLHIISVVQARVSPDAQTYLARKRAEGKTSRDARRSHKRQLANRVIRRAWTDHHHKHHQHHQQAA